MSNRDDLLPLPSPKPTEASPPPPPLVVRVGLDVGEQLDLGAQVLDGAVAHPDLAGEADDLTPGALLHFDELPLEGRELLLETVSDTLRRLLDPVGHLEGPPQPGVLQCQLMQARTQGILDDLPAV